MISPKKPGRHHKFLTVFQMVEGDAKPLPLIFKELGGRYQIVVSDRVLSMGSDDGLIRAPFSIDVENEGVFEFVLMGMEPGFWNVKRADGKVNFNHDVVPGKNTISFKAAGGKFIVTPGRAYGAADLK
ncbi:hypothetical protein D3C87_1808280 [compost metagenome]